MCGRYALAGNSDQIRAYFDAIAGSPDRNGNPLWDWEPQYNIAPGAVVPVIAFDGRKRRKMVPMRWGLHPHWKKAPPEGRPLFNARLETAAEKASFRTPFRRRRAIIPASGWFEWEGVERPKTPYYIHEPGQDFIGLAALWDQWQVGEGITLLSATILTTAATGEIKHLHHRMPVRLAARDWDDWLDWNEKPAPVMDRHKQGEGLSFHAVSRVVNSGRAAGPELLRPEPIEGAAAPASTDKAK